MATTKSAARDMTPDEVFGHDAPCSSAARRVFGDVSGLDSVLPTAKDDSKRVILEDSQDHKPPLQDYRPEGFDRGRYKQSSKSGGYAVTFLDDLCEEYRCMICLLVLRDPMQTECGHRFCASCIDRILRSGEPLCPLDRKPLGTVFQDNACWREIGSLHVKCEHSVAGCGWRGELRNWEDHHTLCNWTKVPCMNKNCSQLLPKRELEQHAKFHCDYRPTKCKHCCGDVPHCMMKRHEQYHCEDAQKECPLGCGVAVARKMLTEHLRLDCPESDLPCPFSHLGCTFHAKRSKVDSHCDNNEDKHLHLVIHALAEKQREMDILQHLVHDREELLHHLSQQCQSLESLQQTAITKKKAKLIAVEEAVARLHPTSAALLSKGSTRVHDVAASAAQLSAHIKEAQRMVDEIRQQIKTLSSEMTVARSILDDHDHRLLGIETATFNGSLVWPVEWLKAVADAQIGVKTSIYSPPFYSSRYGYKMCCRLYPLGDGTGQGTHISLFFAILLGDHDTILRWPFRQRVTLTLIDQSAQGRHISETFLPDASSSSFHRPTHPMNIASGCPRFVSQALVQSRFNDYVKDGKMFFKVAIDLSGLE